MLQSFLSVPVAAPKSNEAYQLAWRPAGARPLSQALGPKPSR